MIGSEKRVHATFRETGYSWPSRKKTRSLIVAPLFMTVPYRSSPRRRSERARVPDGKRATAASSLRCHLLS